MTQRKFPDDFIPAPPRTDKGTLTTSEIVAMAWDDETSFDDIKVHSKWANIQHRKGRQDKARSKLFSKLSKDITIASKMGGPDPDMNPRLRLAIANAKGQSMPKDNIKRAVDKGHGGDAADYEEQRYEGFGPAGIGFIVETSTDNKNRAAMEVRTAFSKNGGNLGETGSVSFGFDQVGEITTREEAYQHLRRAVEDEPKEPRWQVHLGQGLTKAGRYEEAEKAFAAAAELSGGHLGLSARFC